jgi:hypothetical protein
MAPLDIAPIFTSFFSEQKPERKEELFFNEVNDPTVTEQLQ